MKLKVAEELRVEHSPNINGEQGENMMAGVSILRYINISILIKYSNFSRFYIKKNLGPFYIKKLRCDKFGN